MESLKYDWLTEGLIDFEYKKYVLLAYLKDVREKFNTTRLYPFLSELIFHYNNLQKLKEHKKLLYEGFPSSISKADFAKLKLTYKKVIQDDETVKVMEDIITYALPQIDQIIGEGKELFDFVRTNIEFEIVGLKPLYDKEGYIFFNHDGSRDVVIFRYSVSSFKNNEDNYWGINTTYVSRDFKDISRSFERIKVDLSRSYQDLPNPNTYSLVSKMKFPLPETLLPIGKRLIMKEVSVS